MALYLDNKVSYERLPDAPAPKREKFIVVGASHANRTAGWLEEKGASVINLAVPGWRITRPKVAELATRLQTALEKEGTDCTVVYEMFDSNCFLARTEEGGLVPICKRASGEYHVDGDLVFAPKELQYNCFCDAKPLFEAAGSRRKIIISPIPRYLLSGCCVDPDHAGNIKDPDYRGNLEMAVVDCRKNLKDFAFRQGIRNLRVVGPWPALRELGDSIWLDKVHLNPPGYSKIADLVLEAAGELAEKPDTSGPSKRPRVDSHSGGSVSNKMGWPTFKPSPNWQPRGGKRH